MNSLPVWPSAPITLDKLIDVGAERFQEHALYFGHGTNNAWDEALWLALHGLNLSWDIAESALQKSLDQAQVDKILPLFQRRIVERKPAAYLTGTLFFAGLEFFVNEDVLVPRSPIAELIQNNFAPWLQKEPAKILDLCTGSGCIGVACAYFFPESIVHCSDISKAALSVANKNIKSHHLQNRVKAIQSDVFANLSTRYDVIVSNPPYVNAQDMGDMPAEFQAEPKIGLTAGEDGLDICRQILCEAGNYLNPKGCLIVEVGNSGEALELAFPNVPFTWIEFTLGGDGVFVFSTEELARYAHYFQV